MNKRTRVRRTLKEPRVIVILLSAGMLAACAQATPGPTATDVPTPAPTATEIANPILIVTQVDLSQDLVSGTFEVRGGAAALGCSDGTFVDFVRTTSVMKVLTCESGDRAGTFTLEFNPPQGPWKVIAASEDFDGLVGSGDFTVDIVGYSGVETIAGGIDYKP